MLPPQECPHDDLLHRGRLEMEVVIACAFRRYGLEVMEIPWAVMHRPGWRTQEKSS